MTNLPNQLLTLTLGLILSTSALSEGRYIVKYKNKNGRNTAVKHAKNVKKDLKDLNSMAMTLSKEALSKLEKHPDIEYIEEDVKRFPMATQIGPSTFQENPYGISMVQANFLSDEFAGNRTVCIIDSGYDLSHEDLFSNNVSGSNDPFGAGNWFEDQNSHGTHVAGTIAGINNGVGVIGILPNQNINLYIVKVFDASGWAYSSDLADALSECVNAGANVVNMSLGGSLKSRTEETAFKTAYQNGVLSIAAAGNDGNNRNSYPASYSSVVSVAAIDANKNIASFSQYNKQVEISAPGVSVLSSVPTGSVIASSLDVAGTNYDSEMMDGAPLLDASGELVNCGIGDTACANANGKVCLIQRGSISFSDKVLNCQNSGGIGAIIYNNESGLLYGTLGGVSTNIPSVGISDTDGSLLLGKIGSMASISVSPSEYNYSYFDGTSMATPHVTGVAALVWSYFPECSASQIRNALNSSTEDLGAAGRDTYYGYGLVQALAAKTYLETNGCSGGSSGGSGGGGKPGKGRK